MALNLINIKKLLQIEDNSFDNTLRVYITAIEDYIKQYCNDTFESGVPAGLELLAAKMIQFHLNTDAGLESKSIGDASESYLEDYPQHILKGLKAYKKAKFL